MRKLVYFTLFLFIFIFNGHCQYKKNVLFIGNSYTYVNNLPQMLADVALSAGDTVVFSSSAPGGYTFQLHSTNQATLTLIMNGNWDYVILQEQSQRPSFPISQVQNEVFPYAHLLDSLINDYNTCTETMFFMTWGRKNGDASNCVVWPPVCTYEGMDSLLRLRYMMMAEMNDAVVSPVGAVWRYIRENHPNIELYDTDESHPSPAGTYAAAVCFYSAIFRKNPFLITYNSTLSSADASVIRSAVKTVVFDSLTNWYIGNYDPIANFQFLISGPDVAFQNLSAHATDFYWDFGDGTSSVDPNPVHTYNYDGDFTVSLIASHCEITSTHYETVSVSGVNVYSMQQNENSFVFPNPAVDYVNICCNTDDFQSYYEMSDISGRKFPCQAEINGQIIKINVLHLSPGIYFLRSSLNDSVKVFRFLKN